MRKMPEKSREGKERSFQEVLYTAMEDIEMEASEQLSLGEALVSLGQHVAGKQLIKSSKSLSGLKEAMRNKMYEINDARLFSQQSKSITDTSTLSEKPE